MHCTLADLFYVSVIDDRLPLLLLLLLLLMLKEKMLLLVFQVIQRLDEEGMRSRKFLNPSSYAKVTHECEQRMIADHLQFLHGECRAMVRKEKRHGLSLILARILFLL